MQNLINKERHFYSLQEDDLKVLLAIQGAKMDLYEEIQKKISELDEAIDLLRTSGEEKAKAEHTYRVCLRQEALKLRSLKNMPVTLINQIIYGVPEVAKLRQDRDIKEAMYEANLEHINIIKLNIKILENQLEREWEQAKRK